MAETVRSGFNVSPAASASHAVPFPTTFGYSQDMYEFLIASQIWHSLMESATSEQSSRMNAMENASKNAGEMIDQLTLDYNRARQSRITTELIEIISGASAIEG